MDEKALKQLLQLLSFQSDKQHPEEISRSLELLEDTLKEYPISLKKYIHNNKPSFVATIGRKSHNYNPQVLLQGHIDVVEAELNQFKPYIKDGRVYGRGALDMKGGVIVLLELLKFFSMQDKQPSLAVMITSDEEVGGYDGTKFLLQKYTPDFFITAEGETDYLLKIKQKGVIHLKLSAKGVKAHSSYTWLGDNAIKKLIRGYENLEKLFPVKNNKENWYTTINLGIINGGKTVNAIPDYAEAYVDIRYTEIDWPNANTLLKSIRKALGKSINVEVLVEGSVMATKSDNKYVKLLGALTKKHLKTKKSLLFNNHGTNDARFAAQRNIPALGFGPIGENYHSDNEYVLIKSLEDYYAIVKDFLLSLN